MVDYWPKAALGIAQPRAGFFASVTSVLQSRQTNSGNKRSMNHELWLEPDGCQTFCLAGPYGEDARGLLEPMSKLIWQVEASSYFEAMSKYYSYMDWGDYTTEFPEHDKTSYKDLGWE